MMRKREQIENQLLNADNIDSFNGGHDRVSREMILEVLLDIRDLLTRPVITIDRVPPDFDEREVQTFAGGE